MSVFRQPLVEQRGDEQIIEGIIIKAIGGFFFVRDVSGQTWRASARGKLRRDFGELLVGDRVRCSWDEERLLVEESLPRRNLLQRPPVANVDQVVLVFACTQPEPNWLLLDRLLIMAVHEDIRPVIFLNKIDLVEPTELDAALQAYRLADFRVLCGSERQGLGIDELCGVLDQGISVFAGPSGVGKSSLLNRLLPEQNLEIGDVSRKLERGRHTTRQVQLFALPQGGLVADTPGFYAFESAMVPSRELAAYYPEMRPGLGLCRFGSSCLHVSEPDCAVKALLQEGKISPMRYRNYTLLLQEMKEREKKYN